MRIDHLSNSRLSTFTQCPWRYHCRYDLELPDKQTVALALGSAIHETLEILTRQIVKDEIPNVLSKADQPPGLVIQTFQQCLGRTNFSDERTFLDGVSILSKGIARGLLATPANVEEVEVAFELPIESGNVVGRIDRIDRLSDDLLEVIDYKTGKNFYTADTLRNDTQVGIYLLVARALYPHFKNYLFTFWFLQHGPAMVLRSEEELSALEHRLSYHWQEIENMDGTTAPARKNMFCNSCPYKHPLPDFNYAGCPRFYANGELDEPLFQLYETRRQITNLKKKEEELMCDIEGLVTDSSDEVAMVQQGGWMARITPRVKRNRNDPKTRAVMQQLNLKDDNFMTQPKLDLMAVTQHIKKMHPDLYDQCYDVTTQSVEIEIEPCQNNESDGHAHELR